VSKEWKPRRETVELRPSRIRRDPPAAARVQKAVNAYPTEREVWVVVVGVVLFAVAIAIIIFGISDYTAK
jgi:hypothetical protein